MSIKLKDTIYDLVNKASKDSSGNTITSTYLNKTKSETISGDLTVNNLKIDTGINYSGLYRNSAITSSGASDTLWLYTNKKLILFGSEIEFYITPKISGGYTVLHSNNYSSYAATKDHTHSQYLTELPSHNHDSSYVSALGVSGNYVTWTKNGSTNNITVPFATSSTSASYLSTSDSSQSAASCYSDAKGLHFYRYNGDTTADNGGDGFILQWSWGSGSVGGQIYLDDNPSQTMMIRGRNKDASRTFTDWARFLHSGNYTSYTVTKTGSGASGTWGISISGNAATATAASSASVATIARSLGTDDTMKLYSNNNNEVNFGGTNNSGVIFFGYRATDSKAIPTSFIFGSSTGTATVTAKGFIMKDSSNSYVLLGGGGHKAVSDFSLSGHTHNYAGSGSAGGPAYNLYDYNDSSYTIRCGYSGTGLTASNCSYLVGISINGKTISYKDISAAEARSFIGAAASSHSHAYLPTAGGDMSSGARISASGGNLLLGNSSNVGWVQTQDICSQSAAGDTYWSIRQNGTANFTVLKIGGEQITFTT